MKESTFWQLIETCKDLAEMDAYNKLTDDLSLCSDEDIYAFEIYLQVNLRKLCTWRCFASLLLIDIFTDDGHFSDYRCYIISKGKTFFDKFLDDIESVSQELYNDWDKKGFLSCESLTYITLGAFQKKYPNTIIDYPNVHVANLGYSKGSTLELAGKEIYEREIPLMFPKLWSLIRV